MEEYYLLAVYVAVFVIQLLLCLLCKRSWLRLLPVMVIFAICGILVACYILGNNWGILILLLFAFLAQGLTAAAWVVYGIYRFVKKLIKTCRCKEKILDNEKSL